MAIQNYQDADALAPAIESGIERIQEAVLANKGNPKALKLYTIQPGTEDWPEELAKPTGAMTYIPDLKGLEKLVPRKMLNEIKKMAAEVVEDLGLPADITLQELAARNPSANRGVDTNPAQETTKKPGKSSWLTKSLGTAGVLATTVAAQAEMVDPSKLDAHPNRPVSTRPNIEAAGHDKDKRRNVPSKNINKDARKGFTLVELLVALSIIAVLVSLLLPAVQQAREVARNTQLKNNMKQVGLALANRESSHGALPQSVSNVGAGNGVLVPHTWIVDILPELDQSALYHKYDQKKPYDQQSPEVQNAIIPALQHPAYNAEPGRTRIAALSSGGQSATLVDPQPGEPIAINTHNGVNRDYILFPNPDGKDFDVGMPPETVQTDVAGKVKKNGKTSMAGFTDGTSYTAVAASFNHEAGNRDPWIQGKTRITGLMFGPELGNARVNGGYTGNVYVPANYEANHVISHSGSKYTRVNTVLFADGHAKDIAATGPVNKSFTEGTTALPATDLWRKMVIRNDGASPTNTIGE